MAKKPTNSVIDATISIYSNSYNMPTGYGVQVKHLADQLLKAKADVAVLSNYGHEGHIAQVPTPYGDLPTYPRGLDPYSNDAAPIDHMYRAKTSGKKDAVISLYDAWVMKEDAWQDINKVLAWVPIDHVTLPTKVRDVLKRENFVPIAMAKNGVQVLADEGIDCEYAPHCIDTSIYKPRATYQNGTHTRDHLNAQDKFVVGMVAANKANQFLHRKAYSENFLAFSAFHKEHPDSVLYVHTNPKWAIGWDLLQLAHACNIPSDALVFPDPYDLRFGYTPEDMAAIYSAMDVLLAPSMGEGFGVPCVEAQACGTPVIGSAWAASPHVISNEGWLVDGQPEYDMSQHAWWRRPSVGAIVNALQEAYHKGAGLTNLACVEFAKQYSVEKVWQEHWLPIIKKHVL